MSASLKRMTLIGPFDWARWGWPGFFFSPSFASAFLSFSLFSASAAVLFSLPASASRSEEHTSELQSLMRISYDVFCLKKKTINTNQYKLTNIHTIIHD